VYTPNIPDGDGVWLAEIRVTPDEQSKTKRSRHLRGIMKPTRRWRNAGGSIALGGCYLVVSGWSLGGLWVAFGWQEGEAIKSLLRTQTHTDMPAKGVRSAGVLQVCKQSATVVA